MALFSGAVVRPPADKSRRPHCLPQISAPANWLCSSENRVLPPMPPAGQATGRLSRPRSSGIPVFQSLSPVTSILHPRAARRPRAPLHLYHARKGLRAQTCCHRGVPGRKSWPGRRPKISFSADFAGRGG